MSHWNYDRTQYPEDMGIWLWKRPSLPRVTSPIYLLGEWRRTRWPGFGRSRHGIRYARIKNKIRREVENRIEWLRINIENRRSQYVSDEAK